MVVTQLYLGMLPDLKFQVFGYHMKGACIALKITRSVRSGVVAGGYGSVQ